MMMQGEQVDGRFFLSNGNIVSLSSALLFGIGSAYVAAVGLGLPSNCLFDKQNGRRPVLNDLARC